MTSAPPPRQLPDAVRAFAEELRALLGSLDAATGWYAVFDQRDASGLRACLDGSEVPPWDVLASLLEDLAGWHGPHVAAGTGERLRRTYEPCVRAHDQRPGGVAKLTAQLAVMREVREDTDHRVAELVLARRSLGERRTPRTERLDQELAWAWDDLRRAQARCAELAARRDWLGDQATAPAPSAAVTGPGVSGARGAGAGAGPPTAAALPSLPTPAAGRPRGARFAGADEERPAPVPPPLSARDQQTIAATVAQLVGLRAGGAGGPAHVLLCTATTWPAEWLAPLAEELERAGLAADVALLLWELATSPTDTLAAAASALAVAGRRHDCARLLRQAAVRPVAEVGDLAARLHALGRTEQCVVLLAAFVRGRTVEEAVALGSLAGGALVPVLLDAAASVSPQLRGSVAGLLRQAG